MNADIVATMRRQQYREDAQQVIVSGQDVLDAEHGMGFQNFQRSGAGDEARSYRQDALERRPRRM